MAIYHTEDHIVCGSLLPNTPDDNNDISPCFVYVGLGGDLNLIAAADNDPVILRTVPAGSLLPIKVRRVMSIGTTASSLVAVR